MKDFFRVMGKAFAVVLGSTSALALVLILLVLALRPVLRSWSRETAAPANVQAANDGSQANKTQVADSGKPDPDCVAWDRKGRCVKGDKWAKYKVPSSFVPDFNRDLIPKPQPGFTPVSTLKLTCDKHFCEGFDESGNFAGYISREDIGKAEGIADLGEIK